VKEVVIISGKGGTGKTSITSSFCALADNAVIADCDVDAPDLHILLDPDIQSRHDFSGGKKAFIDQSKCSQCGTCLDLCRFDAISNDFKIDPFACEGCGVCVWNCPEEAITFDQVKNGEWYSSHTRFGKMIHAQLAPGEENSGKLVTLVRQKARAQAEDQQAELLIVDGPPGTGCPVIAAIGGADHLLIVTEPSLSALHDLQRAVQLAAYFKIPCSVCINKYDINENVVKKIQDYCDEHNVKIVGKIKFDKSMVAAQLEKQTLIEYSNNEATDEIQTIFNKLFKEKVNL